MNRTLLTFVIGACMFVVYTYGIITFSNYIFSFPNANAVLVVSIVALLISLILAVITVRSVADVYTHNKPDKKRVSMLLLAVLFVIYLFGIESIINSVLTLENPVMNIIVSILWIAVAGGLAVVTRRKVEEWYRA